MLAVKNYSVCFAAHSILHVLSVPRRKGPCEKILQPFVATEENVGCYFVGTGSSLKKSRHFHVEDIHAHWLDHADIATGECHIGLGRRRGHSLCTMSTSKLAFQKQTPVRRS